MIPIVDFSAYGLNVNTVGDDELQQLADSVYKAFTTVGFVYLKGHGLPKTQISDVYNVSQKFFDLPEEVKMRYAIPKGEYYGYAPMEGERLNPSQPGDLKETYSFIPYDGTTPKIIPKEELPNFYSDFETLFRSCEKLGKRVLQIMALGMKMERNYFDQYHSKIGSLENTSCIRFLNYPPVPDDKEIEAGQLRLGEHSDYGSITLLIQDDIGGLEVASRDGTFVSATPVVDTVLVNIGDMMQRWTSDTLLSNRHRVVVPTDEKLRRCARKSMAFFIQPDNSTIVKSLDGSNKYEPINALDYLDMQFKKAYGQSN
ncbi:unnamed protein product [Owenia fusiformis]|uniref:Uncharacterized protein n=1 Tax=Owenia fusiformis TaxID=6347 RepID=A0A8J1U8Z0_OWEFU|nr:unnamed protein product [Owenia fusiformis]